MNWEEAARQAIKTLIGRGQPFTTDDIWYILDEKKIPRPQEPRALGGIVQGFANRMEIFCGGYTRTTRRTAHARPITLWYPVNPS